MVNPAELLYAQLNAWNDGHKAAEQIRGIDGGDWSQHQLAVRHLDAIQQILNELKRAGRKVDLAQTYFSQWAAAVFSYPRGWRDHGSGAINTQALEQLRSLADRLSDITPTADPTQLAQIASLLDELDNVLSGSSAHVDLRAHLANVAAHVRWCASNYEIVGDFELAAALEQLWGTVGRVLLNDSKENQSRWFDVMNKFSWPFAAGYAASLTAPATQALIKLAAGG